MKNQELLKSLGIYADINLKNLTRIGNERVNDGWWLRINRDGIKISKTFSDKDYNNPFLSLQEAIKLRDKIKPQITKSNTGYNNIFISVYDDSRSPFVRASYKGKEKAFNIFSYGYCSALKEAMRWLNKEDNKLYALSIKLKLDKGLVYLNKNIEFEKYSKILNKTLLDIQNGGGITLSKIRKKLY